MSWLAASSGKRGRSPQFSDAAIQFCLTIKNLFGLALRQTTGFVQSLLNLSGLDHSRLQHAMPQAAEPGCTGRIPAQLNWPASASRLHRHQIPGRRRVEVQEAWTRASAPMAQAADWHLCANAAGTGHLHHVQQCQRCCSDALTSDTGSCPRTAADRNGRWGLRHPVRACGGHAAQCHAHHPPEKEC